MKYNSVTNSIKDFASALIIVSKTFHVSEADALTKLSSEYNNMSMAEMLSNIAMKERDYYLSLHNEAIFLASDGRYKTHLMIDGKRKIVPRKKKEDLENIIVNYYKEKDSVHSISSIKTEFLEDRKKYVRFITANRDISSYNRFFNDSPILNKDIRSISSKELSDYRMETIIRLRLNSKETQRFQSLLNAIWDYAVTAGYTEMNVARNMRHIGKAFFTTDKQLDLDEVKEKFGNLNCETANTIKKNEPDEPQYYTVAEQAKLMETCYSTYLELHNTAYLAIIMNFCLGLRIGELVALKTNDFDFDEGFVHIRQREISSIDEHGKRCVRISDRLKNDASKRDIPITETCRYIYELIVDDNQQRGIDSEYLFISKQNGERMHSCPVDLALDRANEKAGLPQRSLHKIRKTVLSRLDMSMTFTPERIRELAGHSRGSMTMYTHYFYTIEGLDGITNCKTFEKIVEYKIPDLKKINKLNQPLIFRRAV